MNTPTKYQWVTITDEARIAVDSLPRHVVGGRLLQDFGLIPMKPDHTVGFRPSKTRQPHHQVMVRSILIINLCNAYNEFIQKVHDLNIKDL